MMKKSLWFMLIIVAMLCAGCKHEHNWKPADCENPMICTECKATRGNENGHSWVNATCTEAKYCSVCAVVEGDPLDHDWQEASCIAPRTCLRCGNTTGEKLEHEWKNATCTEAKTCSRCGETNGDPLGHAEGEWELSSVNAVNATGKFIKSCKICSAVIAETEDAVTKLHDGTKFRFTPKEFGKRLGQKCKELSESLEMKVINEDGNVLLIIEDTAQATEEIWCSFLQGSEFLTFDKADTACSDVVALQICDPNDVVLMRPILFALDPTFKLTDEGEADFKQFLTDLLSLGEAYRNGILYTYDTDSRGMLMILAFAGQTWTEDESSQKDQHDFQDVIVEEATYFKAGYKIQKCKKCGKTDDTKTVYYLWDKAFVRRLKDYSIYLVFDEEANKVFYFTTDDGRPSELTYKGKFSSGVTIYWDGFTEKLIYNQGSRYATLIDANGFEWEFEACDIEEAQGYLAKMK